MNTGYSMGGGMDIKASMGGSAGVTYSSIANIPKAMRMKLIAEAKPMVNNDELTIVTVRRSEEMQRDLASYKKS